MALTPLQEQQKGSLYSKSVAWSFFILISYFFHTHVRVQVYRSRSGSNQPESVSIEFPTSKDKPEVRVKRAKGGRKK